MQQEVIIMALVQLLLFLYTYGNNTIR